VRLVGPNGEQVGIVRVEDALRLAAEADLDLVEVAPMAKPPVAKLMDFGKFKYEAAMKAREARKNQVNTVIKEIKLRPKIDPHDYGTKRGHVERFLRGGDKVKVTIMFRGREQSRPELGYRLLQRLAEDVTELGTVESAPRQDGRNMVMVLAPTRKKSEARAEQRRARQASEVAQASERSDQARAQEGPRSGRGAEVSRQSAQTGSAGSVRSESSRPGSAQPARAQPTSVPPRSSESVSSRTAPSSEPTQATPTPAGLAPATPAAAAPRSARPMSARPTPGPLGPGRPAPGRPTPGPRPSAQPSSPTPRPPARRTASPGRAQPGPDQHADGPAD
jgi:translation initiation factor IF-3